MALTIKRMIMEACKILNDELASGYKGVRLSSPAYRYTVKKRGQYQIWNRSKLINKHVQHRREAIAMCKLLNGGY